MNEPQKLDVMSKILLATQSINYMALSLHSSSVQMSTIGAYEPKMKYEEIHKERVEKSFEVLEDVLKDIMIAMDNLGDYINAIDCICPLDVRVTKEAFEILFHDKDNTEA